MSNQRRKRLTTNVFILGKTSQNGVKKKVINVEFLTEFLVTFDSEGVELMSPS